jgi:hypothetical protein
MADFNDKKFDKYQIKPKPISPPQPDKSKNLKEKPKRTQTRLLPY